MINHSIVKSFYMQMPHVRFLLIGQESYGQYSVLLNDIRLVIDKCNGSRLRSLISYNVLNTLNNNIFVRHLKKDNT